MKSRIIYFVASSAFLLAIGLSAAGCGKGDGQAMVVAKINDYKMAVEDFNYESGEVFHISRVLGDVPVTKEAVLNALITKELLLQEAQKENLDKNRDFLRTIELYWEQTLIRNLLEKKSREISKKVMVYDEDIVSYYNSITAEQKKTIEEMRDEIAKRIKSDKEKELLDQWIERLHSKARIKINKRVLDEIR